MSIDEFAAYCRERCPETSQGFDDGTMCGHEWTRGGESSFSFCGWHWSYVLQGEVVSGEVDDRKASAEVEPGFADQPPTSYPTSPDTRIDPEEHEPFASQAQAADERWESGDRHTITTDEFRERLNNGDG